MDSIRRHSGNLYQHRAPQSIQGRDRSCSAYDPTLVEILPNDLIAEWAESWAQHVLYALILTLLLVVYSFETAAFALSSGTIGAALSAALSSTRAIALSYGTVGYTPLAAWHLPAHTLGVTIIQHLLKNWGLDAEGVRKGEIDLYNVNIPMVPGLLAEEGMPVLYTRIWRNTYGRLFKALPRTGEASPDVSSAGPGAAVKEGAGQKQVQEEEVGNLSFKFAPDMSGLIGRRLDTLPEGSDAWAIDKGWASVTPVRASFAEPSAIDVFPEGATLQDRLIKL